MALRRGVPIGLGWGLAVLTAGNFATAAQPAQAAQTRKAYSNQQIVERLKFSTCWINCTGGSSGTGWLLNKSRRLVVTNQHVITRAKSVQIYFPDQREGEWVNDVNHYLRFVKPIPATVIASSYGDDLALLQLERLPEKAIALKLAAKSPPQGSQLHSIGARTLGSDTMWTYTVGHVRQVGRGHNANGAISRIVEAQMEYNKGNSGGPIVNDYGELVAVVEGYRTRSRSGSRIVDVRNVSIAVDVRRVKRWLGASLPLVDPQTAAQFLKRGDGHLQARRLNQAIRDLSNALRRDGKMTRAFARRGWAFYYKRDYRTALGDFDHALKIDDSHADAHYGRGMVNRKLKHKDEALTDFTNAIRLDPTAWEYYNQRGVVYFREKKYRAAFDDFTRAIGNEPKKAILHENKGLAAIHLGLYRTGIEAYGEAIQLDPRNSGPHNYQGVCYYRLKEYKSAARKFLDAIKLNAKRSLYHENLGNAFQNLNDHKDAVAAYDRALSLKHSDRSYLYYKRGISKYELQRHREAVADLTKSIQSATKKAGPYYWRGKAYRALGQNEAARADFQKAARLNPKLYGQHRGS